MIAFDQLTSLHGKPQSSGLLKANPEDFLWWKIWLCPRTATANTLVRILKNGCNTRCRRRAGKFEDPMPVK